MSLIPLQRCSQGILQPQPTGPPSGGALGNMVYLFIAITPKLTQVVSVRGPSMSQIELFNYLLYF